MHRLRTKTVVIGAMLVVAGIDPRAAAQVETCRLFEVFRSDTVRSFESVAVVGPTDVWVTGEADDTLFVHWNGQTWATVPGPRPARGRYDIRALDGSRSDVVWAVGNHSWESTAVVLRWDGTAWSVEPIPDVAKESSLFDVVALDDGTAYAVGGFQRRKGGVRPLVLRFDGTVWKREYVEGWFGLSDVAGISSDTLWAIAPDRPFLLRRRPSGWKQVWLPIPEATWRDVAVSSEASVWLVGEGASRKRAPIALARRAGTWQRYSMPNRPGREVVWSVAARSDQEVWAVGLRTEAHRANSYAVHMSAAEFAYVEGDDPGWLALWDVAIDELGRAWAAGQTRPGGIVQRGCL